MSAPLTPVEKPVSAFEPVLREVSERIHSLSPYQPGKPIEEVKRELGISGEIVKLASNENPLGPSPKAIDALLENLLSLALYPDGGCHDLRLALAEKLGLSGDHFIFGNGSDEVIHLLGLTLLNEGDEVVVGHPTFVLYEAGAKLAGATTIKVALRASDYTHDTEAMANAFTDRTRLVYIANPHNPTGTMVTRTEVDRLLAKLPARAVLVLDEAYGEFVDGDPEFASALDYIRAGAPVISLRTFSKAYGLAGLRIGYGIGDPALIAALNQARSPFNVNLAAQRAACAALDDTNFLEQGKSSNDVGMKQLTSAFEKMGFKYIPSRANFVMVDLRRPCRPVFDALLRQGVIVRTGDIFGMPTFLRVTIGTKAQNEKFLAALEAVLPTIAETI